MPKHNALLPRAMDRYAAFSADLERSLSREMSRARQIVSAMVGGEIKLRPTPGRGLMAELRGDYAGLVELAQKETPGQSSRGFGFSGCGERI